MRAAPLLLTAALAAFAALAAPPPVAFAVGACETIKRAEPAQRGSGVHRPPLVVGDSSMLLGVRALARLGFEANARGCRQMSAGIDLLVRRKRRGTLPRYVVLALGNNGPARTKEVERALRVLGPRRALGLVTPGGHPRNDSARTFRRAARRHRGRVVLIDWRRSGGPRRHGGDGIHLGPEGEAEEARFIAARSRGYLPPSRRVRVPRSTRGAKRCGRGVFVLRGNALCARARQLARTAPTRPIPGWRGFAWRHIGDPPWSAVYARADARVVIAVAQTSSVVRP